MSSSLNDYVFPLPDDLIAQRPLARREDSRMMVLDRATERIEHRQFSDLPEFITAGDLVVLNDTRVMKARRFSDDGTIEFLFLEQLGAQRWRCLVKPGRKMRSGASARLAGVVVQVEDICADGSRVVAFEREIEIETGGVIPLPPYMRRDADAEDEQRYQTVFASSPGAVAAPTAGLHFTSEMLKQLRHAFVTLHVGQGTFAPVKVENVSEHQMHAERFSISEPAAAAINDAQRVIAVGTTVVRVLESAARADDKLIAQEGSTDIFIYPPRQIRHVDVLLTNFHLPGSTLLMLVSAFAGREFVLRAYAEAVRERYRFYSYGDCMLIL